MANENEEYLVIDDNKKTKKRVLIIIVLLIVIGLVVFGVVNRNKLKFFGSDMMLTNYAKSYINLDGKKYCNVMPDEIINKSYEDKDKCNEAMKKMFKKVQENKLEYKDYEIKDKDEVTEQELKEIRLDLERNYGISSKSVKKIVRYSISFTYKDNKETNDVKVYVAKIDKYWYVIDQKKV